LFRRTAAGPTLSDQDIDAVCDLLLNEAERQSELRVIERNELPGAATEGNSFSLAAISHVHNVNALANGQHLALASAGISVIYGNNGTGKTGYSRILKHAGRSLSPESVLHNAQAASEPPPSAVVTVVVDGVPDQGTVSMRAGAVGPWAHLHPRRQGRGPLRHRQERDRLHPGGARQHASLRRWTACRSRPTPGAGGRFRAIPT
jgi:hypothetical protein